METNILDFTPDVFNWGGAKNTASVNVTEDAKEFKIELAAPGLQRKDFKVEIEDGLLTIRTEKKEEKNEEGKNWIRKEFSYNQITRSFQMPENILADKIDAKYENGILKIVLPKREVEITNPIKEIEVL